MADSVTTQIIENGVRNLVMKFTNVSDGVGETAVVKVDASTFTPALTASLKVRKIEYNVTGGAVRLLWDATTDITFAYLTGYGTLCLEDTQGIVNNAGTGVTADILLTTSGFIAAGASNPASGYTLVFYMTKGNFE